VRTIKTGYWYIAKAAGMSISCWYLDNANGQARWLGEVTPGENLREDLTLIRDRYERAGYRFPLDLSAYN
jgi:hypothetical protein